MYTPFLAVAISGVYIGKIQLLSFENDIEMSGIKLEFFLQILSLKLKSVMEHLCVLLS